MYESIIATNFISLCNLVTNFKKMKKFFKQFLILLLVLVTTSGAMAQQKITITLDANGGEMYNKNKNKWEDLVTNEVPKNTMPFKIFYQGVQNMCKTKHLRKPRKNGQMIGDLAQYNDVEYLYTINSLNKIEKVPNSDEKIQKSTHIYIKWKGIGPGSSDITITFSANKGQFRTGKIWNETISINKKANEFRYSDAYELIKTICLKSGLRKPGVGINTGKLAKYEDIDYLYYYVGKPRPVRKQLLNTNKVSFKQDIKLYIQWKKPTYPATSYVLSYDKTTLKKWVGPETEVDMNKDVVLKKVTGINMYMDDNETLNKFTVGDAVTKIECMGASDMYPNSDLEEIILGKNVTTIGNSAFAYLDGLKKLTCKKSTPVELNDEYVFDGTNISEATLYVPFGSKTAYSKADVWKNFKSIVSTPEYLTIDKLEYSELDENSVALTGCNGYLEGKDVVVPKKITYSEKEYSVVEIGEWAFDGCEMNSVIIGNNVKVIRKGAFNDCEDTKKIIIGNSVDTIEQSVFSQVGLDTLIIPKSVRLLEKRAIYYCYYLHTIIVEEDNINYCTYEGALLDKKKERILLYPALDSVYNMPNSVKYIDDHSFVTADSLTVVNMSNSLEIIGESAFYNRHKLKQISLPNSIKEIKKDAFDACKKLSYIKSNIKDVGSVIMGENVFGGVNKETCLLEIPEGTEDAYKNAPQWQDFKNVKSKKGVEQINLNFVKKSVRIGKHIQLTTEVLPAEATNKNVLWKSSDKTIADVDENGKVTGIAKGKATITAISEDNSAVTATCEVTVKKKKTGISDDELNEFAIYPTLVNTNFIVETKELNGLLYIYNLTGAQLKTVRITANKQSVNVSDLIEGIYIVKYNNNIVKFIKK